MFQVVEPFWLLKGENIIVTMQVVAAVVLQWERRLGIRSSALLFLFWMSMAIYGSLKLRSLVLTSKDQVGHHRLTYVSLLKYVPRVEC